VETMLTQAIEIFGEFSDDSLDAKATKACREFDTETQDPVTFLRNLRDLAVRYSWGSGAIIRSISAVLNTVGDEEDLGERNARHKLLEAAEREGRGIDAMLACKPETWEPAPPPKPREPVVPKMTCQDAIDKAREFGAEDRPSSALNVIFDVFDDHFLAGDFDSVNAALRDLDPNTLSITARIGVLTITLQAKIKLPYRAAFYERVKESLKDEPEERQKGLIGGLK